MVCLAILTVGTERMASFLICYKVASVIEFLAKIGR